MRRTVQSAARRGVVVGAHPSYPDRAGFGRRPMDIAPARISAEVLSQVAALDTVARQCGTRVRYVKPHGALYLRMADDEACARAVAAAVGEAGDLVLLVPAGTPCVEVAASMGVAVATEAFADRAYLPDGRLAPRSVSGAVLDDPAEVVRRAVGIAVDHEVTAVGGTTINLVASSVCVHGDTPGAAAMASGVRIALEALGVTLRPFVS
jgi:5-oxoprolinase (ATP-hydrolysing) subunit A